METGRPTPEEIRDDFYGRMFRGEIPAEDVMAQGQFYGAHDEGEQHMIDRKDLGCVDQAGSITVNGLGGRVWSSAKS